MTKIKCKGRFAKKMVSKSIEAFTYAIETYNKPTITYRVESFSFLICNAWELLLKAHWIETKGHKSIYYIDNPERTLSLQEIVKGEFTNEKDPIRQNLIEIIGLRNLSTHFITEDYEALYAPLFQACVMNFINKLDEYFEVNIYEIIKYPFLTISTYAEEIAPESFKKRYGKELFKRYMQKRTNIEQLTEVPNQKFAMTMNIDLALVKDPAKADLTMAISKEASGNVAIVKENRDINKYFPFNQKRALKSLNERLEKHKIPVSVNSHQFQMICKYFRLYDCIPQVKIPRSASVNSKKCKPLFQNPQNEIPDFRKVKIPNSATENSCFPQKNWGLFFYISSFLISRYAHDLDSPVISTMYLTISFFFAFSLTFVRIISRARFF